MMAVLPMIGTGIMALVNYFKKGEFLISMAKLLGKEGLIGKVGSLAKGAKSLGTKAMKGMGGLKGVGIAAAAGIGGALVEDWADDNMDDGLGKSAVKTAGSALEYGATGATIGSVIPGDGTAVGAGVGAAVGTVVENWDAIVDAAKGMWERTKKAGRTIAEAAGTLATMTKNVGKSIYSHFFGNDVEIDEKTGKVVRQEKANILGRMWEMLVGTDEKKLADGQVVKEGGIGILGNIKNFGLNAVSVFGKALSGKDWEAGDFVKGTVLEGITTKIEDGLTSFIDGMIGIKNGLVDGFKYVTEMRFVDDIKKAVTNWWNGEDETQKKQEGSSEFVGPMDNRSWYQKLGDKMTSWADSNKATVNSVTVGKDGKPIANRAFGGKLGKNGTLVGELGPELLDANGNVIPMGKMQNPALGAAAQQRGGSIASTLEDMQKNSYYTTSLLSSINAALGGAPVKAIMGANDPVFDPAKATTAGDGKAKGLFAMFASTFGINPETGAPEGGNGIMERASQMGGIAMDTLKAAGGQLFDAAKGAGSNLASGAKALASGNFSGAWDAAKSAAGAVAQGVSNIGTTLTSGASNIGKAALGKPTDEVLAAIKKASDKVGVDFGYMMAMAGQESGFNPTIKAKTSSATGLYQFIDSTWNGMVQKYGQQFGIKPGDRTDPYAQAVMGALYTKDNGDLIKGVLGRDANPTELYMGHFLGGGGVKNFLKGMKANPNDTPATMKGYEAAANANKPIFYDNGRPRTFQEIYDVMYKKVGAKATTYAQEYSQKATQLAQANPGDGTKTGIKTAMLGGFLSGMPTLVGERQPEILGPNGQIHRSVDAYLNSPNADVAGLAQSTAIKEAMRRSASGSDHGGANEALGKIASAAGALGSNSDELLKQMLAALQQIAGNTAPISQLAQAAGGNSTVNADTSQRSTTNVFALGQKPERSAGGMHPSMRLLVSGG